MTLKEATRLLFGLFSLGREIEGHERIVREQA
jgi:hypothetical protein